MPKKKTHEEFVKDVKNKNPKIKIVGQYTTVRDRVECECIVCGTKWSPIASSLMTGYGCPHCGNIKKANSQRKTHEQFMSEVLRVFPQIEILSKYMSARKPIEYRCTIHDYYGKTNPSNLLRGIGCPVCAGKKMSESIFTQKIYDIHKDSIVVKTPYRTVNDYYDCFCNKCGNNWKLLGEHLLRGSGCPICNTSKGENRIANWLSENNIDFRSHKTFSGLFGVGGKNLSYDFYLPKNKVLIEYQGQQHEEPVACFGGEDRFQIQQEHDSRKRQFAKDNDIDLLEIWYYDFDNVETILQNKLGKFS